MGRKTEIKQLPADMPEILPLRELSIVAAQGELASLQGQHERAAQELATQLGYEGALTVDALEDEIRFYGRRTVEVLLEIGKRLLILKEMTPHGEFAQRVEVLGIGYRTAASFMSAVKRSNKSATVAVLADRVKNAKAFMELAAVR